MDDREQALAPDINRLYWETGESVRAVCESLDITSSTLYRLLEPLPAGACSACGGALGFRNRTARDSGEATCASCGAVEWAAPGVAEPSAEEDGRPSDPDWVADAVDDALASTEKVFREVVVVAAGLVAVLAVGVVGFISRQRRG